MKPKLEKLAGIPMAVVHRAIACVWTIRRETQDSQDVNNPSSRFVSQDLKVPMVEWKKGIMLPKAPPLPEYTNGVDLRERFMDVRKEDEWLAFLIQFGRFSQLLAMEQQHGWSVSELFRWQGVFAQLARIRPENWGKFIDSLISPKSGSNILAVKGALNLASRYTVEFHWQGLPQIDWFGAKHVAVIETSDVVSTILATLQIDHLRGAKFGVCARPDCPRFFEITSNHKKKYCTMYCGHLESLRRMRKRQKSEAKKGKGPRRTEALTSGGGGFSGRAKS